MDIVQIGLEKLVAHCANANVMSREFMDKLRRHIEGHGYYEPLVVRKHPQKEGYFELINGHHRKLVLEEMGRSFADCVVWEVSDEQALMLLASINRLGGQDDPYRRAALLAELSDRYQQKELLKGLPDARKQLQKLLALNKPVRLAAPAVLSDLPCGMTFFVSEEQKATIEKALKQARRQVGNGGSQDKPTRGDLLVTIANIYLMGDEQNVNEETA